MSAWDSLGEFRVEIHVEERTKRKTPWLSRVFTIKDVHVEPRGFKSPVMRAAAAAAAHVFEKEFNDRLVLEWNDEWVIDLRKSATPIALALVALAAALAAKINPTRVELVTIPHEVPLGDPVGILVRVAADGLEALNQEVFGNPRWGYYPTIFMVGNKLVNVDRPSRTLAILAYAMRELAAAARAPGVDGKFLYWYVAQHLILDKIMKRARKMTRLSWLISNTIDTHLPGGDLAWLSERVDERAGRLVVELINEIYDAAELLKKIEDKLYDAFNWSNARSNLAKILESRLPPHEALERIAGELEKLAAEIGELEHAYLEKVKAVVRHYDELSELGIFIPSKSRGEASATA